MQSPTAKSLEKLREEGWNAAVVERWNQFAKRRIDLFNFADLLAFRGEEILAVQATDGSNVAHRMAKILATPEASDWCMSWTRRLEIWGWRKVGARGKRKLYECRIVA